MKGRNRQVHPEHSMMPERDQARRRIKEPMEPLPHLSSAGSMTQSQPLALQRPGGLEEPWEASTPVSEAPRSALPELAMCGVTWLCISLVPDLAALVSSVSFLPQLWLQALLCPTVSQHSFVRVPAVAAIFIKPENLIHQARLKLQRRFRSPEDGDRAKTPCKPPSWQRLGYRRVSALPTESPEAVGVTHPTSFLPPHTLCPALPSHG